MAGSGPLVQIQNENPWKMLVFDNFVLFEVYFRSQRVELSQEQEAKLGTAELAARRQGFFFLVAAIFSGIFALINFVFAFYNLSRVAIGLARKLKGMTMKINLAEKALKERQLPSNLMPKLQDADNNKNA